MIIKKYENVKHFIKTLDQINLNTLYMRSKNLIAHINFEPKNIVTH